MEQPFPRGKVLRLLVGDITKVPADAIVNAANSGLAGGGGVDGAIHRAGGPSIMRELDGIRAKIGRCPAGPIYRGREDEAALLASCYRTCLQMAEERELRSIGFPSISTGAYRYPMAEAAAIALDTVARHLERNDTKLREAIFVLYDRAAYDTYAMALRARMPR
jgi:O-acetyl-ADP-ribose deacetylase (regulator of RNase III)